jgi:hypothetical protein
LNIVLLAVHFLLSKKELIAAFLFEKEKRQKRKPARPAKLDEISPRPSAGRTEIEHTRWLPSAQPVMCAATNVEQCQRDRQIAAHIKPTPSLSSHKPRFRRARTDLVFQLMHDLEMEH